jgi:hypothetical protein
VTLVTAFLIHADKLKPIWLGERTVSMAKPLLIAGGILNTVFFLFHLFLGYQIHHLVQLTTPYRTLMEALNVGGVLFIFFFAYASFFHGKELLTTGLGRVVLLLVAALYISRAGEEFVLFKFTPVIFGSCLLVGIIYVTLFAIALKETNKRRPATGSDRASSSTPSAAKLHPVA